MDLGAVAVADLLRTSTTIGAVSLSGAPLMRPLSLRG
jgi:hypothetical protein